MLPKTIDYIDYDETKRTTTAWFHLSRKRALDDVAIEEEMAELQRIFSAEEHELTTNEKQLVMNFLKKIIKMSYGERSADGKRFKQTNEAFEAFEESAAYDQFITDLFIPDPSAVMEFIYKVTPPDVQQQVEREHPELTAEVKHISDSVVTPNQMDRDIAEARQRQEAELAEFEAWKASRGQSQ